MSTTLGTMSRRFVVARNLEEHSKLPFLLWLPVGDGAALKAKADWPGSHYQLDGQRILFTHTEIDDAYAGSGLGKQLMVGMLAEVEERRRAVVALCPTCPRHGHCAHTDCSVRSVDQFVWNVPSRSMRR